MRYFPGTRGDRMDTEHYPRKRPSGICSANGPHIEHAVRYFDYLAKRFPVMCASDEFHFLPRAQAASRHYDALDNLDAELVKGSLSKLKEFQREFRLLYTHDQSSETRIDLELLQGNVAGILLELEQKKIWKHNPLLYLKIAFIGLDHALTKPASEPRTIAAVSPSTVTRSRTCPAV